LLLTAVVAVFAAAIMSARTMEPQPDIEAVVGFAVFGFVFGVTAGCFLGMYHGTRKRDIAIGVLEGALFGPPTFALMAIPNSLPVVLVGGVVLVGFALLIRLFSPGSDDRDEIE
jgi:hypothetical protein